MSDQDLANQIADERNARNIAEALTGSRSRDKRRATSHIADAVNSVGKTLSNQPDVYYDPEQDRMVFSDRFKDKAVINSNYESIYEGCDEDIKDAFGLNVPNSADSYDICDLSQEQKSTILKTLKSKLNQTKKWSDCLIKSSGSKVSFAEEFKTLLDAIAYSECFQIKDKAGNIHGVNPPVSFTCQIGLVEVPWKFLYIDFGAQRWTDVYHVVEKLLNYDSKRNLGLTGRFDPLGIQVDINDGRHSAMLLALTGIDHALIRGPYCSQRVTNMNTFEVLNSQAKPIHPYDELNFMFSRAEIQKEADGIKSIDRTIRETGSKMKISDRQVYEMYKLLEQFGIQLVHPDMGNQNRRNLEPGSWYVCDRIVTFIQDTRYATWDQTTGGIKDSYLYDALSIVKQVLLDNEGYASHEMVWGLLELFKQTHDRTPGGLTESNRKLMRQACVTALMEWLPEVKVTAKSKMIERAYEFFAETKRLKGRVPSSSNIYIFAQGNGHIQYWLATGLYSLIKDSSKIKQPIKSLFVCPEFNKKETQVDGSEKLVTWKLIDDRNEPISFDFSFKTAAFVARQQAVTIVEEQDYDE